MRLYFNRLLIAIPSKIENAVEQFLGPTELREEAFCGPTIAC